MNRWVCGNRHHVIENDNLGIKYVIDLYEPGPRTTKFGFWYYPLMTDNKGGGFVELDGVRIDDFVGHRIWTRSVHVDLTPGPHTLTFYFRFKTQKHRLYLLYRR